jgi:flagellar hook-associated protein 3 FlgL
MRVTQYGTSQQLIYTLDSLQQGLNTSEQQLSSGQQLTVSSDNPGEVSQVINMEQTLRENAQYQGNLTSANTISTATNSALSSLKSILVSAQDLGLSASSDTGTTDTSADVTTLNSYIEEAIDVANTQSNGVYLFGGTDSTSSPISVTRDSNGNVAAYSADNPPVTYQGSTTSIAIPVSAGQTISPYSNGTQNQQVVTAINALVQLRDAVTDGDSTTISSTTKSVGDSENVVIDQISAASSVESRISAMQTMLTTNSNTVDSNISSLADVDTASATVKYQEMETAYTAAVTAAGKIMNYSLLNYISGTTA